MLDFAQLATKSASKVSHEFLKDSGVVLNEKKDIKTMADEKMNDIIISILNDSFIPIISEESNNAMLTLPKKCWIIDPLDGTFNFTRGYPFYGVSIALLEKSKTVLSVVEDISSSKTYYALKGEGAKMNNENIKVSLTSCISDAILTTGFPSGGNYTTENLLSFINSVQKFKKIRAIGSASIMLCHVAQGICDVYYENDIYLWDIAAGILIVEEAGGRIYMKQNGNSLKYEVLACNKLIFDQAFELLVND